MKKNPVLQWKVYYDYGRKHMKFRHKKTALAFAAIKNGFIIPMETDHWYHREYGEPNLENIVMPEDNEIEAWEMANEVQIYTFSKS